MSPAKLIIGINIVALIFMFIGFLKGREGLKYTLVRFIFFLLAIGLALVSMDFVAEKLASLKFIGGKSIGDVLISLINGNSFLSGMYNSSDNIRQVIDQLPKVMMQSISYTISLIFFMIVCSIAYKILKVCVLRHITWFDTGKKNKDQNDKKSKFDVSFRSKLFGGLMGMVYGFVVLMFLVMPLSGVINTVSKVLSGADSISAEESEENEETETSVFGETFDTVRLYIDAYHNTPLGAASGIAGMDIEFTRKISSVKLNGKRISVIDKVENMKSIYADAIYFAEFKKDYKDLSSVNNLDLTRAKSLISYLLNNELFSSVFDDASSYTIEYFLEDNRIQDAELREYVTEIYNQMQIKGSPKLFVEDEIFNILDVGQIIIDSEIFTEVNNYKLASEIVETEENKEEKKAKLDSAIKGMFEKVLTECDNDKSYISNAVAEFNDSKFSNVTANFVFNKILGTFEQNIISTLSTENLRPGLLGRVELSDDFNFEEIGEIVDRAARIYNEVSVIDFSQEYSIKELFTRTTEENEPLICDVVTKVGDLVKFALEINSLQKVDDNGKTILDNICYYFPKANIMSFINLEYIQEDGAIDNEVELVNNILRKLIASEQFERVTAEDFDNTQMVKEIVSFLATDTNAKYVTENLLSTKLFRNIEIQGITKGMNMATDYIKAQLMLEGDISEINTEDMFTDTEKEKISDIIQKMAVYYNEIQGENLLYNFMDSDFNKFAVIFDDMRDIKLFADYGEGGYYKDLMLRTNEAYGDCLDLEVATHSSFSWVSTMDTYSEKLKSFINHPLIDTTNNNASIKMADVIAKKTEMTLDEALVQLTPLELLDYKIGLAGCEIIKPTYELLIDICAIRLGE